MSRILVIDDSRDAAHMLKVLLTKIGHQVEAVCDGRQGVEAATQSLPEIVFCDIGMPTMDGYEVAQALRADERTRGAYLVALTGYGEDDDRAKAIDAGFDQHLVKPIGLATLQQAIANADVRRE
jgi:CheY-like chemotaxis protein